jgi:hypothetical protein
MAARLEAGCHVLGQANFLVDFDGVAGTHDPQPGRKGLAGRRVPRQSSAGISSTAWVSLRVIVTGAPMALPSSAAETLKIRVRIG